MSVRARATIGATAIVAVALACAAFGLLVVQRRAMLGNLDDVADVRASGIAELVDDGALPRQLTAESEDDALVRVVGNDGRVIAETKGWSTRGRRIASTRAREATVYVATSVEPVDDAISTLRRALLVGGPVLLLVAATATWLMLGRALRPVERIRAEVAGITERSLDRRVPVPDTDDEIARLASTMNTMLDRLESGAERQRRFVADASHEMQTPLASMRTDLEVALAHPERGTWQATATDVLAANQRLTRLVQDLLVLARADGAPAVRTQRVDLAGIVRDELAHVTHTVDASGVNGVDVVGNADDLTRVVRNLLSNADRHARSRIVCSLGREGTIAALVIADDGPGIPTTERERVFERFARVDAARTRGSGGTGLGLAIVLEIVHAHRGSVRILDVPGCTVRVELPLPD